MPRLILSALGTGAVLLLAGVCLLLVPPPADAFYKAIWGPVRTPSGSSAFPIYQRLGVDVFQIQLAWSATAPTRPANPMSPDDPSYQWPAELDEAVREARRHGIRVAIMVKGTPPWANSGHRPNRVPSDPRELGRFFKAAARRYPGVRMWMVWGEPARTENFDPLPVGSPVAPRTYARMLDASYGALKQVSRRNIVIGGMTFTYGDVLPADWVRWMRLPSGRPPRMDWWGHNPFSRGFPALRRRPAPSGARGIEDIATFAREIRTAYRHEPRPPRLWLSEYTVSSDRGNRAFDFYVSRQEQARWVTAAFRVARKVPAVVGLGWYGLFDEPATMPGFLTVGLMTADGRPKPAFGAFRRAG